jgi:hypothetical protein
MHWLSPFFYMEAKFGPLERRLRKTENNRDEFFRTAGYTLFDHKRNKEILEELKVEPI